MWENNLLCHFIWFVLYKVNDNQVFSSCQLIIIQLVTAVKDTPTIHKLFETDRTVVVEEVYEPLWFAYGKLIALYYYFADVRPKTPPVSISDIQKVRELTWRRAKRVCTSWYFPTANLKLNKEWYSELSFFLSRLCDTQPPQEEEEEMSTSPGVSEFVSDAFDSTAINQEDLRKEMEQLVLDKKESVPSPDG